MPLKLKKNEMHIFIAEDDDDDFMLLQDAFNEARITNPVIRFTDGDKLLDQLNNLPQNRFPLLIVMDMNMPRKNGYETLKDLKGNAFTREIPVIIYSTSKSESDVKKCTDLGCSSFIKKESSFSATVAVAINMKNFWIDQIQSATTYCSFPRINDLSGNAIIHNRPVRNKENLNVDAG